MTSLHVELPPETLEAIAQRAAAILAEQLPETSTSPFFDVDEAAAFLKAKRQRVYDLLSQGTLTRHKDGSRVLVSRAELEAHVGLR